MGVHPSQWDKAGTKLRKWGQIKKNLEISQLKSENNYEKT